MSKLSKSSKSFHKKWQMEAEAKGGKGAKVIVTQPEAKRAIVNLLKDSFRPMNITSIYEALKATVPSPLLKSCLEAMSISATDNGLHDDDSDDDTFAKTPKSKDKAAKDEFTGMIMQKTGRNANTTLYCMNQQKLPNNGNGIKPEDRNELVSALQNDKLQLHNSMKTIQDVNAHATLLLSQPLNEELERMLQQEESQIETLSKEIETARKLKVDEKQIKSATRKVEKMASHWRKRKRLCVDFLNTMEDCTEGTISAKKCLAGNGQIEVESDDAIIKHAKAVYSNRSSNGNKRRLIGKNKQGKGVSGSETTVQALESFVGVKLGPNNTVERIIVEDK